MNILKIESDFLKGLFSTQSSGYVMTEYEGRVGYCDGHYIAFVPKNDAYVKCERPVFNVKTVITDIYDHFVADYEYTITTQYGNLARFNRVDRRGYAYIDVKYIKYFDKDASYFVKDTITPVHVYEDHRLVGIICPVRIKEE